MIPEKFYQYWQGKRRHCSHKHQQFDLTLEHAWLVCQQYWPTWRDSQGRNQWIMTRLPGVTAWQDGGVQVLPWHEHYKQLTRLAAVSAGPGDVNMREYTEQPVRIEIDGEEYPSINEARRSTGVSASTIRHRCMNTRFPNYRRLD